jgi:hypothetical protein
VNDQARALGAEIARACPTVSQDLIGLCTSISDADKLDIAILAADLVFRRLNDAQRRNMPSRLGEI